MHVQATLLDLLGTLRHAADALLIGQRDRIVKRSAELTRKARLFAARKAAGEEFAALAQAFLVDAMADPGRDVPLRRHIPAPRGPAAAWNSACDRDEFVGVAVDQAAPAACC